MLPYEAKGQVPLNLPIFSGHKGDVLVGGWVGGSVVNFPLWLRMGFFIHPLRVSAVVFLAIKRQSSHSLYLLPTYLQTSNINRTWTSTPSTTTSSPPAPTTPPSRSVRTVQESTNQPTNQPINHSLTQTNTYTRLPLNRPLNPNPTPNQHHSNGCTNQVWGIPEGGLKENVAEPLVDLRGHERKVTLLRFHPTAMHLLGSASADNSVKLWDVEKGKEVGSCTAHEQLIQDLQWDYAGGVYATTSKDKTLRVVDARSGQVAMAKAEAHEGAKSSKCTFLGPRGLLLTVGFTKQSRRQVGGYVSMHACMHACFVWGGRARVAAGWLLP